MVINGVYLVEYSSRARIVGATKPCGQPCPSRLLSSQVCCGSRQRFLNATEPEKQQSQELEEIPG